MSSRLRVIATGQIAQYPLGGVTWFYLQYLLGLKQLGHDVYYIEDSGQWPYNPHDDGLTEGCDYNVQYLKTVMDRFGLTDRWAYRFPWEDQWFGLGATAREELLRTTDLLLNVSGTFAYPGQYRRIPRLAYIDTDPVFTQVKLARGQDDFRALVDAHDTHFSYGEVPSATVPETGHHWRPTRAPIVLSEWHTGLPYRETYTTVSNWTAFGAIDYDGRTYGQKDTEFKRFMDLPERIAPIQIEIAMGSGKTHHPPRALMQHKGWRLVDPNVVCPDLDSFRDYTEASKGEFGIAKHGYVLGASGWFSERSARYLASGRPVIAQDTGFPKVIPTGEGLFSFQTIDDAVAAFESVESDYPRHARRAREIAETYFDAGTLLSRLVDEAMSAAVPLTAHKGSEL